MKAQNMPESLCKAMADMTISWKNCGTGFQMMKCFGGMKAKTCAKFDEEFCEKGQCGMPDSKCVVTKKISDSCYIYDLPHFTQRRLYFTWLYKPEKLGK